MAEAADRDRQQYQLSRKCWRKTSYKTSKRARQVAKRIFKDTGNKLYVYTCGSCGSAHLTKNILAKGKTL